MMCMGVISRVKKKTYVFGHASQFNSAYTDVMSRRRLIIVMHLKKKTNNFSICDSTKFNTIEIKKKNVVKYLSLATTAIHLFFVW